VHKSRLGAIVIDCEGAELDAAAATFWSRALGRSVDVPQDPGDARKYRGLDGPGSELKVLLQAVDHPSRVHIDIETDDVEAEVARLERLGAKRVAHVKSWWVMEAPTGHRFCVVRPQRPDFDAGANVWDASPG
jgi:hypothetical protein